MHWTCSILFSLLLTVLRILMLFSLKHSVFKGESSLEFQLLGVCRFGVVREQTFSLTSYCFYRAGLTVCMDVWIYFRKFTKMYGIGNPYIRTWRFWDFWKSVHGIFENPYILRGLLYKNGLFSSFFSYFFCFLPIFSKFSRFAQIYNIYSMISNEFLII